MFQHCPFKVLLLQSSPGREQIPKSPLDYSSPTCFTFEWALSFALVFSMNRKTLPPANQKTLRSSLFRTTCEVWIVGVTGQNPLSFRHHGQTLHCRRHWHDVQAASVLKTLKKQKAPSNLSTPSKTTVNGRIPLTWETSSCFFCCFMDFFLLLKVAAEGLQKCSFPLLHPTPTMRLCHVLHQVFLLSVAIQSTSEVHRGVLWNPFCLGEKLGKLGQATVSNRKPKPGKAKKTET